MVQIRMCVYLYPQAYCGLFGFFSFLFLFNFFFLLCPKWRGNGFLWFSTEIKNFLEGSADATLNLDQLLCSCGEGRNSLGRMVHNVQAAWLWAEPDRIPKFYTSSALLFTAPNVWKQREDESSVGVCWDGKLVKLEFNDNVSKLPLMLPFQWPAVADSLANTNPWTCPKLEFDISVDYYS